VTPPTTHIAVFTYEIAVVNGTDYNKLQVALSALCAWAEDWQLSISISKCCVLHIGKGNVSHQFFINGSPLPVINSSRDLGITITSTLLFADHITNIVAKAHQRANTIHRCFRNTTLLVRTFVTYCTFGLYLSVIVLYGLPTTKVIPCQLNKCRDVLQNVCLVYETCHTKTSVCAQLTVTWTTQTSLRFNLVLQNIIWARLCQLWWIFSNLVLPIQEAIPTSCISNAVITVHACTSSVNV